MNLLSLKRELGHLKAVAFSRRKSSCVCGYVEIIDGQDTTTEQDVTLTRNRECYERNNDRNAHVGFSRITVPSQS
jgi:hypothetical protein